MQLHIRHETVYRYDQPLKYSIQSLKLTPRRDPGQRVLWWRLSAPGRYVEQTDAHGNVSHLLTLEEAHTEITIVAQGVVDTGDAGTPVLADDGTLSPLAYLSSTPLTQSNAEIREFAAAHLSGGGPLRDRLVRLGDAIAGRIRYEPGVTDVTDGAIAVFEHGRGVCQDQAHAFVACCRAMHVPARYVSGYFHTGDAGVVASHAWADAWLGSDEGWLSVDLTHRSLAGERHCRLAVGRDYLEAAPVRGVRRGGGHEQLRVRVIVADSAQQQQQ
jgi:transglutaminase-like putative cysteine protease